MGKKNRSRRHERIVYSFLRVVVSTHWIYVRAERGGKGIRYQSIGHAATPSMCQLNLICADDGGGGPHPSIRNNARRRSIRTLRHNIEHTNNIIHTNIRINITNKTMTNP